MKYVLFIFISLMLSNMYGHADDHINIGDKAQVYKDAGRTEEIHPDLKEIRIMHPEFLLHKRDKTLRQGVRTESNSLKACVDCHSSTDTKNEYISINQQEQFCSTCHKKVGISLDCFSCHRNTPKED